MKKMIFCSVFFSLFLSSVANAQWCTIQLISIKCIETESALADDNIYLKFNGSKIWQQEMGNDDEKSLYSVAIISFKNSAIIELWDEDTFDPDDYLGSISPDYLDAGRVIKEQIEGEGAKYEIIYSVKLD